MNLVVTPAQERQRLSAIGRQELVRRAERERDQKRAAERRYAHAAAHPATGLERVRDFPYQLLSMGRKLGKPIGGYVDDLTALRQTVLLCEKHFRKFDHRKAHYFHEKNLRVGGKCDACREEMPGDGYLFIHESRIGPRSVWLPRQ